MFSQSIPQMFNSLVMIIVVFVGMLMRNVVLTGVVILCVLCMLVVHPLCGRTQRQTLYSPAGEAGRPQRLY